MEPQTPLAVPPKHNNRKFIIIIASLFVLFTVSASLMYFVKDQLGYYPEVIQNQKSNNDSEWKTYRNEEYGFEFKYPQNFIQNESLDVSTLIFDTFNHEYYRGGIIPKNEMELSILRVIAPKVLDEYIDSEIGYVTKTDILVDGIRGRLVKIEGGDGPDLPNSEYITYVIKDKYLLRIELQLSAFQVNSKMTEEFNHIMSTFKFTK